MLTLAPFTFCTNNVPGPDPVRAMDMAHRCGFRTIELAYAAYDALAAGKPIRIARRYV